jgi:uncharacterized protein with von Willebrand factor type A (vWA) domain
VGNGDNIANNLSSIAQLFDLPEVPEAPGKKSEHVVRQDSYESEFFNDLVGDSAVMQETVARGAELLATFDLFTQDAFLSLFKYEPELVPDEEVAPGVMVNKRLMDAFFKSEDFNSLRAMTQLDALASALGTEVLAEKTILQLEQLQQNKDEQQQDNPPADSDPCENESHGSDNQPSAQDSPVAGNEPDEQDSPAAGKVPDGNNGSADAGNDPGEKKSRTGSESSTSQLSEKDIADIAGTASKDAAGEVKEVLQRAAAWGIEPGDPTLRVNFREKREALEKLRRSPKLKELSELVGRFRVLAKQMFKKRGMDGSVSICNVTTGGDLDRVLPSEKMALAHPGTKMDFLRRYHQKELLQYKSKELPAGKGPLIVCCDVSGSMRGVPEQWSKAVVLALAEIAQRQKRNFACILFDSKLVGTWVIPKGIWSPSAFIAIAETAPSGGTNFELPLLKAYQLICESKFNKADVVFITDGCCPVDDGFIQTHNEAKERKGFAVFTVLINIGNKASSGTVSTFSDEVLRVSSLAELDDGTALALFNKVKAR